MLIINNIIREKLELLEGKTSQSLQKLGLSQEDADFFESVGGKLGIWLFNAWVEDIKNEAGVSKSELIQDSRDKGMALPTNEIIMRWNSIKDYIAGSERRGQPVDIKSYSSLDKAYQASRDWHKALKASGQVMSGDLDSFDDYEGHLILEYPEKNGKIFYWEDLETNDSELESERMGHCGHSPKSTTLYSLRSRYWVNNIGWLGESHITIGVNENSKITYQIKGKNNSLPSEKYHSFIVDLLLKKKRTIKHFGTEYEPKNDFKISQLNHSELKRLGEGRPDLLNSVFVKLIELLGDPDKNFNEILSLVKTKKRGLLKDFTTYANLITVIKKIAETDSRYKEVLNKFYPIKKYEVSLFDFFDSDDEDSDTWAYRDQSIDYILHNSNLYEEAFSKETENLITDLLDKMDNRFSWLRRVFSEFGELENFYDLDYEDIFTLPFIVDSNLEDRLKYLITEAVTEEFYDIEAEGFQRKKYKAIDYYFYEINSVYKNKSGKIIAEFMLLRAYENEDFIEYLERYDHAGFQGFIESNSLKDYFEFYLEKDGLIDFNHLIRECIDDVSLEVSDLKNEEKFQERINKIIIEEFKIIFQSIVDYENKDQPSLPSL